MRTALGCCGLYQHEDAFRDGSVFTVPSHCVGAFEIKTSLCLGKENMDKNCRNPAISAVARDSKCSSLIKTKPALDVMCKGACMVAELSSKGNV